MIVVPALCLAAQAVDPQPPEPPGEVSESVIQSELLLGAGNEAHARKDFTAAVAAWTEIVARFPETPAWYKALYNLGVARRNARAYAEAIAHFERLILSKPPEREVGGNIMENYRNYSHNAALQISYCYEAQRNFAMAIHWNDLATTRYPMLAWCGTCAMGAEEALRARSVWLRTKQAALGPR